MKRCCFLLGLSLLGFGPLVAQTSSALSGPMLRFTATAANVAGAPDSIRIDLLRWSTDAEREKLMAAWDVKPGAVASEGSGPGGRGGRGGAGRGGAGREGRGGAAAGPGSERAKPMTPERSLAAALQQATTVGYLWSSEVVGYAIRYAGKVSAPDGSERMILITDRRLGENNHAWDLKGNTPAANYGFSVIELRLNAKGEGEGRITLTGQVAPDPTAGIVTAASYEALPVVLTKVKRNDKRN
jgi:hypothetical protein